MFQGIIEIRLDDDSRVTRSGSCQGWAKDLALADTHVLVIPWSDPSFGDVFRITHSLDADQTRSSARSHVWK